MDGRTEEKAPSIDLCKLDRIQSLVQPAGGMDELAWSPWPELPPELAGMVFCRLLSYGDRLRFRAVCRRWQLAARQQHPLPPALPWLGLDRTTYQSLPDGEVHRVPVPDVLPAGTVCRGSFDGWLLYDRGLGSLDGWLLYDRGLEQMEYDRGLEQMEYDRGLEQMECLLMNPISKATIDLPYHCDEPINHDFYGDGRHTNTVYFYESATHKIVVCSPDLVVAIIDYGRVLFHRPGMQHSTWSLALAGGTGSVCDITLYRGKLYSITSGEELLVHEFSSASVQAKDHPSSRVEMVIDTAPPLENLPEDYYWRCTLYLVVSCTGTLLMVRWRWRLPFVYRCRRWFADELPKEIRLDVFEADLEKRRWLEVKEIGDQALFVGKTCSKALVLPDHGNCIFFLGFNITELCSDGIINGIGDCAYCVYDMKNGTFRFDNPVSVKREALYYGLDNGKAQRWRADWFFPCE